MKNLTQKIFSNLALYVIFFLLFSISSCGKQNVGLDVEVEVGQRTLATLDKAINTLGNESANWQQVLQETRDKLVDSANSSIKNEVTNLINNGIAATGIEVRCNVDFMRNRTRQELVHLRNKLAQKLGVSLLPESSLEPGLCQVTPSSIDLNLTPERRSELKLAGYDFNKSTVSVLLLNADKEIDVTSKLAQPTKYLLTLNLSPANGINFSRESNKVLVKTTQGGKLISEINIIQSAAFKARFKPGFYSYTAMKPPGIIYLWPSPWDSGLTDVWCGVPNHEMYVRHIGVIGSAIEVEDLDKVKNQAKYWSQDCSDDVFQQSKQQKL